jgi:hypothetical protein
MPHVAEFRGSGGALRGSLVLLAAVVVFALVGLAAAGNWPKFARVSAAAGTYGIVLLGFGMRTMPRLRLFITAGAAAGAVSGLVRPSTSLALVTAGALGAGLLLAPLHWWAVRAWQRIPR